MSLVVDVSGSGTRAALSRERVRDIARFVLRREKVRDALVSIALVSPREIAAINRAHLKHASATDVISFALDAHGNPDAAILGDIYICPDVARDNARAHGVPVREELARLVVHGVLHVLGHDHPDGEVRLASPMWTRQEGLVRDAKRVVGW
jgi:probable rRNA maturation factor